MRAALLAMSVVILASAHGAQAGSASIELAVSGAFRSDAQLEIEVTTHSDEAGDLIVVTHPGDSPCGPTLASELSPWPDALGDGLVENVVPVGTSSTSRTFQARPGRWRVCAYVENKTGAIIGTGTTTFTVTDTVPPKVRAHKAQGKAGSHVVLEYVVRDDSLISSEQITVYLRRRALAQIQTRPRQRLYETNVRPRWRSPRGLRGTLRFCVFGTDPTGNRSKPSCAPLVLR
jgi:hypothetical protein